MWKYIGGTVIIGSVAYYLLKYFAGGVCYCKTRLDGHVVVITGGNSGIGRALAVELAKRGATIVLACRDIQKGLRAKKYVLSQLNNKTAKIFVKKLDLCDISSIVKFSELLNEEFGEIYALVNNAGVFYHPQGLTKNGYDITLQTNYLGTNIIINAVNPGNVETSIYRNFPSLSNPWLYAIQWPIRCIVIKSPRQGAQTVLHALLSSNRSTGQYYSDCKLVLPSPIAANDKIAKEYYELTLEVLAHWLSESEC